MIHFEPLLAGHVRLCPKASQGGLFDEFCADDKRACIDRTHVRSLQSKLTVFQPWLLGSPAESIFWSIHTPHFRPRIGWLDSSRIIGLSFASFRPLCYDNSP